MESAMAVATEKVRSKRYAFPPNAFEILQFIITNHDEGRLLDVIYNRDTGINFQKLAAWTEITDLFNKVSVSGVLGSIPASSDTDEAVLDEVHKTTIIKKSQKIPSVRVGCLSRPHQSRF
jgi:hypothetical protein